MDDFFSFAVRCPPFSCQKGGDCEGRGEDRGEVRGEVGKRKKEGAGREEIDRDPTRRSQMIRLTITDNVVTGLSLHREKASRSMVQERSS